MTDHIITGVVIEESTTYSVTEICHKYHIPKQLMIELVEEGLFPDQTNDIEQLALNPSALRRLETAFRLHRDLEVNLPGVALALQLLDEIEQMRSELSILRKHF